MFLICVGAEVRLDRWGRAVSAHNVLFRVMYVRALGVCVIRFTVSIASVVSSASVVVCKRRDRVSGGI